MPKLVAEDIPLLYSLLSDVFPGIQYTQAEMKALRKELANVCNEMYLTYGEGDETGSLWVEKVHVSYHDCRDVFNIKEGVVVTLIVFCLNRMKLVITN